VRVAREPPRVHKQLVTVRLDERPERGQDDGAHDSSNVAGRADVSAGALATRHNGPG
jgi:hypothetical protein